MQVKQKLRVKPKLMRVVCGWGGAVDGNEVP